MTTDEYIRKTITPNDILCQLAEEASELAQAALKLRRATTGTNPTPVTVAEARRKLLAEIADVEVAKYALGLSEEDTDFINDVIGFKLTRWAERLRKKEESR